MRTKAAAREPAGFTLVELVIAISLIAITAVTLLQMTGRALSQQSDSMQSARIAALGEAYAAQILARRFDENAGPGGVPACSPATSACSSSFDDGETRDAYDDVDDFDGLDESPPLDADGNALAGYAGYRVQVSVDYADAAMVTALGLDDPSDLKVVDITLTPPSGTARVLRVLRGNY
jgi:MSHA pilin protein MshD